MKNTSQGYGSIARFLHWFMAIGIIGMMAVGVWMVDLPNGPDKGTVIMLHKSFGFTLLFFFVFRLYWHFVNVAPPLPNSLSKWQKWGAKANHLLLYVYMASMLLTGTFMSLLGSHGINWFGLGIIKLPYENKDFSGILHAIHVSLTQYAWFFLAGHILVAFYHHWFLKDRTLMRMVKGS